MNDAEIKKVAQATGASEQEIRQALGVLGNAVTGIAAAFQQAMDQARKVWEEIEASNPRADLARLKQEVKTEKHPLRKKQLQREIQRLQFEIKRRRL